MPIRALISDTAFTEEETRCLIEAFEATLKASVDRADQLRSLWSRR
jgi:hypothetical protein